MAYINIQIKRVYCYKEKPGKDSITCDFCALKLSCKKSELIKKLKHK